MDNNDAIKLGKRIKFSASKMGFGRISDDIAQEILCRMLEGRHQHATVDQAVIDYLRREFGHKRSRSYDARYALATAGNADSEYSFNSIGTDPRGDLDVRWDAERLVELLRGRDRIIANQYYLEGYSEAEVANFHNVSESRVCQILKRIQSGLSKRVAKAAAYKGYREAQMEAILFIQRCSMEFSEADGLAFEEPREVARLDGVLFEAWIA